MSARHRFLCRFIASVETETRLTSLGPNSVIFDTEVSPLHEEEELSAGIKTWSEKNSEWYLRSKTIDRPFISLMRFPGIGEWARNRLQVREILRSADRTILHGPLLAALHDDGLLKEGSKIIWIGCASYTAGYYTMLESQGGECFTIELDPAERGWGRPGRHIAGSMLELDRHYPAGTFDLIICNGVLGWGVNAAADQRRAFDVMAYALKPGGALVLGWNTDKMANPVEAGHPAPHFNHQGIAGFPQRHAVEGVTHIYDCFRRRN